jgi:hypothetical protein
MPHRYTGGVQIVMVTMPKAPNQPDATTAIWLAAVPRERAIAAVRAEVPGAFLVELSDWY